MSTFVVNDKNLPLVLNRRCLLIDLPTSITDKVTADFVRWYRANGPSWAVDRMKVLKQVILNRAAGQTSIPKDAWIRRSKYNRNKLAGVYGRLSDLACQNETMLKRVLTLLQMYTTVVNLTTSSESIQKFRNTVETPGPQPDDLIIETVEVATKLIFQRYDLDQSDVEYAPKYELSSRMKPHQEKEFLDIIERTFRTQYGIDLIDRPCVFMPLLNVLGFRGYRYSDTTPTMGRIFRIPSPGLKDRWVCDFNKAFDHCLKPMGKRVYNSIKELPWDITYDESKCYHAIQSRLREGKKVYSFDLSSATDRFPWILQLTALRAMCSGKKFNEMVTLYDDLIHLPAEMPDGSLITWKQGQPLGAYPSFATFSFTHGALLYGLNDMDWNEKFFVHGDDVVILDDDLAVFYHGVMERLGVELSLFKTLQSDRLAEINSKVISAKRILTIPKWKPITRHNTLGQVKNWGLGVLKFLKLKDEERAVYERVAALPVCLGGAGVNPYGLPLEKRMEGLEDILFKEKELSYEGSSRSKVLSRYLANPNFHNLLGNALREAEAADQAALKHMPVKVYGDHRDLDILGKNAYSVDTDLPLAIDPGPVRHDSTDEVSKTVRKIKRSSIFGSV